MVGTGAALLIILALWLVHGVRTGVVTDWRAFDIAADRLVDGETDSIYLGLGSESTPFLYPPYVLWLVAPLAWLGPSMSFVAVTLACVLAALVGLGLAAIATNAQDRDRTGAGIGVFMLSGGAMGTVANGQLVALVLCCAMSAAVMWGRGRPYPAGLLAGLLMIKPQLAALPLGLMVVFGNRRFLAGVLTTGLALLLAGSAFGFGLWGDFYDSTVGAIEYESGSEVDGDEAGSVEVGFQPTVLAVLRQVPAVPGVVAVAVWAMVAVLCLGTLVRLWRSHEREDFGHLFAVTLLAVVVLSPRLYFPDWLLVGPAFLFWWSADGGTYRRPQTRRRIGLAVGLAYVGSYFVKVPELYWITGSAGLVWLLLELIDMWSPMGPGRRRAPVAVSRSALDQR